MSQELLPVYRSIINKYKFKNNENNYINLNITSSSYNSPSYTDHTRMRDDFQATFNFGSSGVYSALLNTFSNAHFLSKGKWWGDTLHELVCFRTAF